MMRLTLLMFLLVQFVNAQTSETQILDANITLNSGDDTLRVYLSEQSDLNTLQVRITAEPEDSTSIYDTELSLSTGGSFWNQGTIEGGVLVLPLGDLSNEDDYYTTITLALTDATTRKIEIHTSQ
jgi:hypothetical protein